MVGTAYSNFWNDSYSLLVAKPSARKRLHRFALNTRSMRKQKELMLTLNGAAAGSAAADKTDIDTMLTTEGKSQVATYPTDASGNGGGGKLSHVQS